MRGERGLRTALELFESFVAFECAGQLSDELLLLLQQCIVDNFEEEQWVRFVFEVQRSYLRAQVSVRTIGVGGLFN